MQTDKNYKIDELIKLKPENILEGLPRNHCEIFPEFFNIVTTLDDSDIDNLEFSYGTIVKEKCDDRYSFFEVKSLFYKNKLFALYSLVSDGEDDYDTNTTYVDKKVLKEVVDIFVKIVKNKCDNVMKELIQKGKIK